jgi:uncharacterized protein (TIGR03083 family)
VSDLFARIHKQRLTLVDVLTGLGDEEWDTPSLCEGWTVHEVVAHLTMPFRLGVPSLVAGLVRARGNFALLSDRYARSQSQVAPSELVALLRREASNRFTPPGLGPEAPLSEIVIHSYDVAIPTYRALEVSEETSSEVLDFLVTTKAERGFTRKGLVAGLRLESSDSEWSSGVGALVRGPTVSLLLALTGRARGFTPLEGDGVQVLRSRSSSQ